MNWGLGYKTLAVGAGGDNMQENPHWTLCSDIKDLAEVWKPIFVVLLISLSTWFFSVVLIFHPIVHEKEFPYSLEYGKVMT